MVRNDKIENKNMSLFTQKRNSYDCIDKNESEHVFSFCNAYKLFIDQSKTERLVCQETIKISDAAGFQQYKRGQKVKPGDKLYFTNRAKSVVFAVIGLESISKGMQIVAAHTDTPRIDLKPVPFFEDSEILFAKTHYYGRIKKYQWVTLPLAIYGTVVRADGTSVDIAVGKEPDDPVFWISDLPPNLAQGQLSKNMSEGITGEELNIILGSLPTNANDKEIHPIKLAVMSILNKKFGLIEDDFISADLSAVPAISARDIGFDRSLIGAYGHDDRVCVYTALQALITMKNIPRRTAICVFSDKEEIGSEGVTSMKSSYFDDFISDLCDANNVLLREAFENSFCISADVCTALDATYPYVSDKLNCATINGGLAVCKYTGHGGKFETSDASAEVVGKLRMILKEANIVWQLAEMGKVDQGGAGTLAKFFAQRNIDVIDAGVPILGMHSPFEVVSKFDIYTSYKAFQAVFQSALEK